MSGDRTGGTRVKVLRSKTFVEDDPADLDTAVETWAREQGEVRLVGHDLTSDGTNIILTIFYAG